MDRTADSPLESILKRDIGQCEKIEQRLIGRLLAGSPGAIDCLPDILEIAPTSHRLHHQILDTIAAAPHAGVRAITPAAIALRMAKDEGLTKVGGKEYLVDLARSAPAETNDARGRSEVAADVAQHRQLIARIQIADRIDATHKALETDSPDALSYLSDLPELLSRAGQGLERAVTAAPYVWKDAAALPTREWLYGHHLIRKFASATIAAGGVGKSSLSIAETISLVTGKPLLGVHVARPRRVWLWNLEDPTEETERRIQAACLHYSVSEGDIEGRLFHNSGRDQPCVIASSDRFGTTIVRPLVERIVAEIKAKHIDVLVIDPFVACHQVSENDNGAIEMVAKEWARVADRGNCAVELVHHSRKIAANGTGEVTAEDARGASALVNACRSVRVINRMAKDQAEKAGVKNPRLYFRALTDKLNLAPPPDASDWYRLESISIGNGPPSDHVGVVVPWQWPDAFDGITPGTLFEVQKHIASAQWRKSDQCENWAGRAVSEVLHLDLEDNANKARVRALLKEWIRGGALKEEIRPDDTRQPRPFIEVGQWAAA